MILIAFNPGDTHQLIIFRSSEDFDCLVQVFVIRTELNSPAECVTVAMFRGLPKKLLYVKMTFLSLTKGSESIFGNYYEVCL